MDSRIYEIGEVSTELRSKICRLSTDLHLKTSGKVNFDELLLFLKIMDEDLAAVEADVAKCSRYLF